MSKTICPLPWNHLATHPQGGVSLCCRVDYTDGVGMSFDQTMTGDRTFKNLNTDSVSGVINSDSFKQARLQMLAGEKPLACAGCYKEEEIGIVSKRQRELKSFKPNLESLGNKTSSDGSIDTDIQYAELRLGNLCNLKCRTCNPYSSSKWVTDYNKMQIDLDFVRNYSNDASFSWAESEKFWEDFFLKSSDLKQLYINGGEPTLIKQHWQFLEKLIEKKISQNIEIKYNINMTYLPDSAFSIWSNFKNVFIGASVDDLQDRNSYIRHGADWEKIVSNIKSIRDAGFGIAVEQTVSMYNVYYLNEMEDFCNKHKIGYGLNFVYDPDFLSLKAMPEVLKKEIFSRLKGKLSEKWFNEVNAHLNESHDPNLWKRFMLYTRYLDLKRHEIFGDVFFEYSNLIKKLDLGSDT